jgi:hypothetical protein
MSERGTLEAKSSSLWSASANDNPYRKSVTVGLLLVAAAIVAATHGRDLVRHPIGTTPV